MRHAPCAVLGSVAVVALFLWGRLIAGGTRVVRTRAGLRLRPGIERLVIVPRPLRAVPERGRQRATMRVFHACVSHRPGAAGPLFRAARDKAKKEAGTLLHAPDARGTPYSPAPRRFLPLFRATARGAPGPRRGRMPKGRVQRRRLSFAESAGYFGPCLAGGLAVRAAGDRAGVAPVPGPARKRNDRITSARKMVWRDRRTAWVCRKTVAVGAPPRGTRRDPASRALNASAGLPQGVAFPVGARWPGTRRLRSGL